MNVLFGIQQKLSMAYHLCRMLVIPDRSLPSLIYLGNRLSESRAAKLAVDHMLEDRAILQQVEMNYAFTKLNLAFLQALPSNTFGHQLWQFFTTNNLTVYPVPEISKPSPDVYLRERRRKVHDYMHLVLGYGIDLEGEAELNAFVARQTGMPISYLIVIGVVLKTLFRKPHHFRSLMHRLDEARLRADFCVNLFAFRWEDYFDQPIEKVQRLFEKRTMVRVA